MSNPELEDDYTPFESVDIVTDGHRLYAILKVGQTEVRERIPRQVMNYDEAKQEQYFSEITKILRRKAAFLMREQHNGPTVRQ